MCVWGGVPRPTSTEAENGGDRRRATGRCFMFNQPKSFSHLQRPPVPLSSPSLLTSEIKVLRGPESHRGVIRVCFSLAVLSIVSSPALSGRRGGVHRLCLCAGVGWVGLCLKL